MYLLVCTLCVFRKHPTDCVGSWAADYSTPGINGDAGSLSDGSYLQCHRNTWCTTACPVNIPTRWLFYNFNNSSNVKPLDWKWNWAKFCFLNIDDVFLGQQWMWPAMRHQLLPSCPLRLSLAPRSVSPITFSNCQVFIQTQSVRNKCVVILSRCTRSRQRRRASS